MSPLENLWRNPAGLLAVAALIGVAVVANLALIALLRGVKFDLSRWRRALDTEAGVWRRAVAGGQQAQRQQTDQLSELRQLVGQLPPEPAPPAQPNDPPAAN